MMPNLEMAECLNERYDSQAILGGKLQNLHDGFPTETTHSTTTLTIYINCLH